MLCLFSEWSVVDISVLVLVVKLFVRVSYRTMVSMFLSPSVDQCIHLCLHLLEISPISLSILLVV